MERAADASNSEDYNMGLGSINLSGFHEGLDNTVTDIMPSAREINLPKIEE